jgi:hypothetical protein
MNEGSANACRRSMTWRAVCAGPRHSLVMASCRAVQRASSPARPSMNAASCSKGIFTAPRRVRATACTGDSYYNDGCLRVYYGGRR